MNRITNLIAIAALGIAATGCSVLSKSSNTKRGDSGQVTSTTVKNVKDGDVSTMPEETTAWIGGLDGDWTIVRAGKHNVHEDPENMPYIYFETSTGRFYASNGCSIFNGNFSDAGTEAIKFAGVLSTSNDCPQASYRQDINSVLTDGVKVKLAFYDQGDESYADLISTGGTKLMTLRQHNLESINGKWFVSKIGHISVNDPEVNLFFDASELKVHGNTGCNYFNGNMVIDPNVERSISFEDMGVTMRMCENQEIEMAMLVALEQAHTYHKNGNELTIYSADGKEVMKLKR